MKHIYLLILLLATKILFGQTINPAENYPRCPTFNFPNGTGYTYIISFPDTASKYTIGTEIKTKVLFFSTPYNNDVKKASVSVQFEDQSASAHKFEVKKGTTVVKTFEFTRIHSIADRTLALVPPSLSVPLCNTVDQFLSFPSMKMRKTGSSSSADEYGSGISYYEHELPAGWIITYGYVGQSSTPGLVVATNNVTIKPNSLTGGSVRVRAVNTGGDLICGDFFKKSQWSTIAITNRPALNLKSNRQETISINCAETTPRTHFKRIFAAA